MENYNHMEENYNKKPNLIKAYIFILILFFVLFSAGFLIGKYF